MNMPELSDRVGEVIAASPYRMVDFFNNDTMKSVEVKV